MLEGLIQVKARLRGPEGTNERHTLHPADRAADIILSLTEERHVNEVKIS
jgi:hypothetical protein